MLAEVAGAIINICQYCASWTWHEPSSWSYHLRERGTMFGSSRLCALRLWLDGESSQCQQEMSSGPHRWQHSQYYSRATQQSIWETQRIIANCEYCHQAGKVSILSMRCTGVFWPISHTQWHPIIRILSVSKTFEQNWCWCPGQDKATETENKMLIYILENLVLGSKGWIPFQFTYIHSKWGRWKKIA